VREYELTLLVLLVLDIYLYGVANLKLGVVTELRRKKLSASSRRVRSSKVLLRTSLLTVYSLTSAVWTDSSTSQTCLGAA
jgi:hypothetical protein